MTAVTTRVRIQTSWYRQRSAATKRRAVTGDATALRFGAAGQVLRVIKADVEVFFETIRKAFARRITAIHTLMADRAHRNIRRRKLGQMTTGAIFVAGKTRPHRIVRAMVTVRAGERRVPGARVQKFRIVLIASL